MLLFFLYYYPQKVCNFHMQVFQIKLKYLCSKPIKLQKFLTQKYNCLSEISPPPPTSPEYWEHSWQNMKLYKLLVISLLTHFCLYTFNSVLIFCLSFAFLIRRNFYICIFYLQRLKQSLVAIPFCPAFMGNWSICFVSWVSC